MHLILPVVEEAVHSKAVNSMFVVPPFRMFFLFVLVRVLFCSSMCPFYFSIRISEE